MSPLLNDPSLVHHHDLIRVPDGGEPVGDGNKRFARRQLPDGGQKQMLVLRVHTGSRLIQNHDGGVLQNGAGNGDPLLLAAGEGGAALSHHRMIAVGQRHDKVVALGAPGRLHHLLVSGVGIAEFDVVLNGVVEEIHILEDHGEVFQQAVGGAVLHIRAAHADTPLLHIPKTGDQAA